MKQLENKVAIVTGGSKGIGKAISQELAREGAITAILARDEAAGESAVAAISKDGGKALFLRTDITRLGEVETTVARLVSDYGRIDILVNNAGSLKRTALTEISAAEWNEVLAVNLTAVFNCIRSVAPVMTAQASGKIVNISSLSGKRGSAFLAHYSAAKAGVIALTQAAAKELGPHGIYVNAIASGRVLTELSEKLLAVDGERWKKESLLGRLAEAREIARVVLFLATEESSYVIGETINVNGGAFMD